MTYRVLLVEDDEGVAVSVPALPGCCSQGGSVADALENIKDAIRDYLEVVEEEALKEGGRLVTVEV